MSCSSYCDKGAAKRFEGGERKRETGWELGLAVTEIEKSQSLLSESWTSRIPESKGLRTRREMMIESQSPSEGPGDWGTNVPDQTVRANVPFLSLIVSSGPQWIG